MSGVKNILEKLEPPERPEQRIAVAMSGGVDSSVTAALYALKGYKVTGITMQLYDHGTSDANTRSCCAGRDIRDAKRVADDLDIAHYTVDYEQRFHEAVIEDFASSYMTGETPVPCIRCNERVKFIDLLTLARDLGADGLATGHYVQKKTGFFGPELYQGAQAGRDQSYFLFTITRPQLEFLRFPLGGVTKEQTRELAQELGLSVAAKPDSQDICFVPDGDYAQIVREQAGYKNRPGEIVHVDGRVMGDHEGIENFTIGQRRGLGIAVGEPLYVIRINAESSRVEVGPREALLARQLNLRGVNWLGDKPVPEGGMELFVKLRSTQTPRPAILRKRDGDMEIHINDGEYGVSPGQAAVFYNSGAGSARVLGGGWIAGVKPK